MIIPLPFLLYKRVKIYSVYIEKDVINSISFFIIQ